MSDFVIETKKLTKIYGEQTAVSSVDIHVKPGRIYGLLGRNGAGKTTIMKMILGLTPITSGEVDVFGQNIKGHEKRIYPRIGAIIETPGFYPNLTGTENLEIFAKLRGTPRPNAVKNALEVVGLPYRDKKLFSKYSLGMKQRLGIANAILHDPELLILDEPTNGLDPIGIAEVRNFIKDLSVDRGKTILISSHILSEIALLADDIGIIDHGVLLEESSMEDLEKKNRKYIQLRVSDVPKASLILERQFHVTDYAVQDEHNLRLYDTALDMAAINKALVVQDVAVISSQICNDTLEDYFKQITGERALLKLIQVEFLKLRRRKFIWLMLLAALFMPLAAVFYFASVKGTGVEPIEFYKWTAFSYTPWIILPVVLGMLCTMLMYNENQYDKHTRTASIETQQLIIARYLEQNPEIIVVQTYIDNGATGTNFHRPGFQQMLSDIEAGLINCVIVKDLSRLGRNVIDTGYYIERYFPTQGVRFIAVNDRYDSSSPDHAHDGIIIPLRNMINEAYALDIAKKIKAQQRQAMKDGKYVGGRTPYGYLKAPDDCHQLIVDPVAAEVVKTMFQWAAEGDGLNTIAVRLNEAGVLSPSHYKKRLGEITHENLIGNGNWQTRTVAKILRAGVYAGDLVQGVSKVIDHKQVRASADEWTVVRDTHEAIVSRELFDAVQKALDHAAQQAKDREIHSWSPNLLRGKIFCAHCGHSLHRQKCVRKKTPDVYVYHCISNNRIKKGACPGTFIFEKELLDALADMIQEQLDTTLGQYSIGLESLSKEAEEQKSIQAKIASRKQEIQQLRTYQRGLYEGLIQNHLSQDEYFAFKEKYEAKIEAVSKEIEHLKAGLAIIAGQLEQYKMLSQDAKHIKEDRQLTAALIDRLIERVEVSREKQITVHFRFQSEFEHCEEVLNQCRNM